MFPQSNISPSSALLTVQPESWLAPLTVMLVAIPQMTRVVCLSYTTPVVLYHTMRFVLSYSGSFTVNMNIALAGIDSTYRVVRQQQWVRSERQSSVHCGHTQCLSSTYALVVRSTWVIHSSRRGRRASADDHHVGWHCRVCCPTWCY